MSLFWISWYQPTEDHRPVRFPPTRGVIGWWCTGIRCHDDAATLVSLVNADSEKKAKGIIVENWPEAEEWCFCNPKDNTVLSDRFPISDWMANRIKEAEASL